MALELWGRAQDQAVHLQMLLAASVFITLDGSPCMIIGAFLGSEACMMLFVTPALWPAPAFQDSAYHLGDREPILVSWTCGRPS